MVEELTKSEEKYGLELTANERRRAIYNAVLRRTNDLQGIENLRLQEGFGQLQRFNTQIKDLQQNFGETLLPSYIEILKAGNAFLEWLSKLPKPIKDAISGLSALAGAITSVGGTILVGLSLLRMAGLATLATTLTAALPTIGLVVAGLALSLIHI